MRVLVFGAGAVGQAVGGLLAEGGCRVTMLLRPRAAEEIARDGLHIEGIFGEHHVSPGRLTLATDVAQLRAASPDSAEGAGAGFDFVLVTVKSYDTAGAAEGLKQIDDSGSIVVSMQNGYGNVERLAETLGGDRVLCGRVITGFVIPTPGTVRITVHADSVTIGRFDGGESPPAGCLASTLTACGLPARGSRQVQAELWAKILYNCALNSLGAILGVNYGRLAERDETRELMDRIIDEAYGVMQARHLPRLFPTASDFRDAFYGRMLPPTAAHTPSMLQDIRAGKRTEIDALNGAIVTLGATAGVATPINQVVAAMVKFLESRGR